MAWTHYTAPLAAGDELTAAMWQELVSAFEERLIAVGGTGNGLDAVKHAQVVASRLETARIYYDERVRSGDSFAGSVTARADLLHTAIGRLASYYAADATLAAAWVDAGELFLAAATSQGLTGAQWSTLTAAVAAGWQDRRYWNVCRAAVLLLRDVRLVRLSSAFSSYERRGFGADFTARVADFFTKGDTGGTNNNFVAGAAHFSSADALRSEGSWLVPSSAPFTSGHTIRARADWLSVDVGGPVEWKFSWGGSTAVLADLGPIGSYVVDLITGATATGTVVGGVRFAAHDSSAAWAPYDVPGGGAQTEVNLIPTSSGRGLWARGNWTYGP